MISVRLSELVEDQSVPTTNILGNDAVCGEDRLVIQPKRFVHSVLSKR